MLWPFTRFGQARGDNVKILNKDTLRRQLGLPLGVTRPTSEVIAVNTSAMTLRWLLDFTAESLEAGRTVLRPGQPNPRYREPASRIVAGTSLNAQYWREPRQRALVMHEFNDVLLATNGNDMAIWRGTVVADKAFGVPKYARRIRPEKVRTLGTVALCDDYFLPGNPCHVLCDRMVRAVMFRDAGIAESDVSFTFAGSRFGPFVRDRVMPAARTIETRVAYRVERLLLLSTTFDPYGHPFFYGDANIVDAIVGPLLADLSPGNRARKLYLARTDATRRPLLNERELIARLEAHGFHSVLMGSLSPGKQLGLCREAAVIVAPHGAAMMNALAAEPGTRVVELFNPEIGSGVYTIVSHLRGHDYRLLFGAAAAEEGAPADAWRIDIDAVLDAALG